MDDLADRLRDAGTALADLRGALVAGEPWPLSEQWGTEPEASWGPREVLAHVDEMLPYWVDQLQTVLAGDRSAAVPFGRIASDPSRLARIDAARQRSTGTLLDDIDTGLERTASFAERVSADDAERIGHHSTRGDITVRTAVDSFLATHLEEHVEQLRGILARART